MKETKIIASFFDNKRMVVLWVLFISLIGLHIFWISKAAGDGKFFLHAEDEVIYYASAKLFSATNSVKAEGCIDENVSRVGEMNWYGPGYSLVYGSVFKVTGVHPAVFPWFHFGLAFGILGLVFLLPVAMETRLLVAIGLSVTEQFCVYIYTFFPETLILFLAMILTLLLTLCYYTEDHKHKRRYLIIFVGCTLLFMLCRITFIFWLAGLVGLAHNRRSFFLAAVTFFAGVMLSLIYMKFFVAPAYAGEMHKIDLLYEGKIVDFVSQTWEALWSNFNAVFVGRTSVINVLIGLIITAMIAFYFTRSKLILAALLICFVLLGTLFAYYSVYHFYFIKQTAMLIPLLLVSLQSEVKSRFVSLGWVVTLLLVFPSPFRKTGDSIKLHKDEYERYANSVALEKAFSTISDKIQSQRTVILWCYREYDYGSCAEALLPFSTRGREPISYTTGINDPNDSPENKFIVHNKLKVDYLLSRQPISWPNLEQIHETEFFHLYKIK